MGPAVLLMRRRRPLVSALRCAEPTSVPRQQDAAVTDRQRLFAELGVSGLRCGLNHPWLSSRHEAVPHLARLAPGRPVGVKVLHERQAADRCGGFGPCPAAAIAGVRALACIDLLCMPSRRKMTLRAANRSCARTKHKDNMVLQWTRTPAGPTRAAGPHQRRPTWCARPSRTRSVAVWQPC